MRSSKTLACRLTSFVKTMGIISQTHHPMASSAYKRLARTDHTYHHNVETQKPQRGFVFMYIGKERKRYEIPVTYLNYPMLKDLMKKLLQDGELECRIDGPIVLLCTAEVFDQVLEECAAYTIK